MNRANVQAIRTLDRPFKTLENIVVLYIIILRYYGSTCLDKYSFRQNFTTYTFVARIYIYIFKKRNHSVHGTNEIRGTTDDIVKGGINDE